MFNVIGGYYPKFISADATLEPCSRILNDINHYTITNPYNPKIWMVISRSKQ